MSRLHVHAALSADELLLASQLLRALEHGELQMHATDYRDMAQWAALELSKLDTAVLHFLRRGAPAAFIGIVENVLHQRQEPAWSAMGAACHQSQADWDALLARLVLPVSRGSRPSP